VVRVDVAFAVICHHVTSLWLFIAYLGTKAYLWLADFPHLTIPTSCTRITQMWGCLQPHPWLWSEADSHKVKNSTSGSNMHTFVLDNHVFALPALISIHQQMQVFVNY